MPPFASNAATNAATQTAAHVQSSPSHPSEQAGHARVASIGHTSNATRRSRKPKSRIPLLFAAVVVFAILYGWMTRGSSQITAEEGLGYYLGIIGGSAMLLLLLYPVRKSVRFMNRWGPIKFWFRSHMVLGVLGPILTIYHSNFTLGSLNSNVALFSMLLVASSGVIGRYFYAKIHFGLYGERATLAQLRANLQLSKQTIGAKLSLPLPTAQRLLRLEQSVLQPRSFIVGFLLLPFTAIRIRWEHRSVMRVISKELKVMAKANGWNLATRRALKQVINASIGDYVNTIKKTSQLSTYEKLFSLWHLFHLPLFIMLIISGVTHVVAVHMY